MSIARAAEIKQLHEEVTGALRQSLPKAIRIGELLAKQKQELDHGEWGKWLKNSLGAAFCTSTANNYMKLHANRAKLKFLKIGNLAEAYGVLYGKSKPKTKKNRKDEGDSSKTKAGKPKNRKEMVLSFTKSRVKEVEELIRWLGEKEFHATAPEQIIYLALKLAKEALNDKNDSTTEFDGRQMGAGSNGKVSHQEPFRPRQADFQTIG